MTQPCAIEGGAVGLECTGAVVYLLTSIAGAAAEDDDVAVLEVLDGILEEDLFGHPLDGEGSEHLGLDAALFKHALQRHRVDDGGEHAHVVALPTVETLVGAADTAEDVAAADDDAHLHALLHSRLDFTGIMVHRRIADTVTVFGHQRFTTQFQ